MESERDDPRRELFSRNALGEVTSELFKDYENLFSVCHPEYSSRYELLSVYVRERNTTFSYVGSLDGQDELVKSKFNSTVSDLLHYLRPYLHNSDAQFVDCFLTGVKSPFSSAISEFSAEPLQGYAMGKYFSWLELGTTRINYIDPAKLGPRLKTLHVNLNHPAFTGRNSFYLIYQICHSSLFHYYKVKRFVPSTWSDNDAEMVYKHIKSKIKMSQDVSISCSTEGPRAFTFCKVHYNSHDGSIEHVDFNRKLFPCGRGFSKQVHHPYSFEAEVLDGDFLARLADDVREMKTIDIWQPALIRIYQAKLSTMERHTVLKFLHDLIKKFQTTDTMDTQMVDKSVVVKDAPQFLERHQSVIRDILRGVGVILTKPSREKDSDDEEDEQQIIFQPYLCQENLAIMDKIFTVFIKGIITTEQGESAAKLKPKEVSSLQELYYTQMSCWCSPQKTLNPREDPLCKMWIKGSRTRTFLESFGIYEKCDGKHMVVLSPSQCQIVSVLSLFFNDE